MSRSDAPVDVPNQRREIVHGLDEEPARLLHLLDEVILTACHGCEQVDLRRRTLELPARDGRVHPLALEHGLSLTAAAEALGLSRRQVAYYASGEQEVPRTVLLALKGWETEATRWQQCARPHPAAILRPMLHEAHEAWPQT